MAPQFTPASGQASTTTAAVTTSPFIITPLIIQHAEDAAFYWMQRHAKAHSPLLSFERLRHFDYLLETHLDGLQLGGQVSWDYAIKNLQRWKGADEAFVATLLAFTSNSRERMQSLWEIFENDPARMQNGVISALGWMEESIAMRWITHWLTFPDSPLFQQIALRVLAIRRLAPTCEMDCYFDSEHSAIRAAACTLAGRVRLERYKRQLHQCRQDPEPEVREAAVIALQLQGDGGLVLEDLWQLLQHWNALALHTKGQEQSQAIKRAETLVRHLAHAMPAGYDNLENALVRLPPRQELLLMAHHGDAIAMPWILNATSKKEFARLGAWAFTMITGANIDALGLTANAPDDDEEEERPAFEPEIGLSWPHPGKLAAWWNAHAKSYPTGTKLLYGKPADDIIHCLHLLLHKPQAARWAAAFNLALADKNMPYLETGADAHLQQQIIKRLLAEADL